MEIAVGHRICPTGFTKVPTEKLINVRQQENIAKAFKDLPLT